MQPGCATSSGKGWAGLGSLLLLWPKTDSAQSILLWAVVPIKPNMKCWERRSLFSGYRQQQAQMFPVAVTQQNLPWKRGCGCCVVTTPICAILMAEFLPSLQSVGGFCQITKSATLNNRARQIRWLVNLSGVKTLWSRFPVNWITEYLFFHWNFDYYFSAPRYLYCLFF